MAAMKDQFKFTVLGALAIAQSELLSRPNSNTSNVEEAVKELKDLLEPIADSHFGCLRSKHEHRIGRYFPMLQRMAQRWYKQFLRRLSFRCAPRNPWKVLLEVGLPKELFDLIKTITSSTNYGVLTGETKGRKSKVVLAFTSFARVRSVFNRIMNTSYSDKEFLKKNFKDTKKIEAIIDEDKQFGMTYDYNKEILQFDFHYGVWNEHGFPKHI